MEEMDGFLCLGYESNAQNSGMLTRDDDWFLLFEECSGTACEKRERYPMNG